jgi:tRNA pseudouridine55 synthase
MTMKHGIIVLNKPGGMTSHRCVSIIRRLAQTKKVGHTGTLDPDVTGVLPVCIGQGTRVAEYLLDYDKEYVAEIVLGRSTTTEDESGETVADSPLHVAPTRDDIEQTLQSFVGEIEQVPPMYSAVKVQGVRLHQLARQGKEVERKSRKVQIYSLNLLDYAPTLPYPVLKFRVRCSKGTYIRTLGVDIGRSLGLPAHLKSLVRTKSGPYTLEQSVTFDEIETWSEQTWQERMLPLDSALTHLPRLILNQEQSERVLFGQSILIEQKVEDEQYYRVYAPGLTFLAIYEGKAPHLIRPKKVFLLE